jgi:hypothetical protein
VGPVIGAEEAELARRQTFGHYATGPPISRSMFNRMWRERHSNVKVCLFFVFVLLVVVSWEFVLFCKHSVGHVDVAMCPSVGSHISSICRLQCVLGLQR